MLERKTVVRTVKIALSLGVTSALGYYLLKSGAWEKASHIFREFDRRYILIFAVISLSGLVVRAARIYLLARILSAEPQAITYYASLLITGIRNVTVDLLPARVGEIAVLYVFRRFGLGHLEIASLFGGGIIFDFLALIFVVALLYNFEQGTVLSCVLTALIFVCLALGVKLLRIPLLRVLKVTVDYTTFLKLFSLTVILRCLKYASLYVLLLGALKAFNQEQNLISPLTALVSFIGAEAASSLPISGVLGFGAYEGTWSMALAASGIELSGEELVALGFSVHVVTQVFGYLVGGVCIGLFKFRSPLPIIKESVVISE